MLAPELRPIGWDTWDKESWDCYRSRLVVPDDPALKQFYRQIPYDHFDHFNERYSNFELGDYTCSIVEMTAGKAAATVRCFGNLEMRQWCWQYDEFERTNSSYPIFREMSEKGTAPFPPVLIDACELMDPSYVYGKPLHLIEGTHRFSYLIRMLERQIIRSDSPHSFVLLEPK
ncbi:MAG TPA: hypothetical protein DEP46_01070 [Blastocatellia bacterium]|nr:hypothetical protein [Blastocatellia bacterium]